MYNIYIYIYRERERELHPSRSEAITPGFIREVEARCVQPALCRRHRHARMSKPNAIPVSVKKTLLRRRRDMDD